MVEQRFSGFKPDVNVGQGLWSSLRLQVRVIGALMLREAMARYGRENLGFFWLVCEPLLLSTGVMIIWSFAEGTGGRGHDSIMVPMALSGYATLTLQRHVVSRAVHRFRSSTPLLFHRKIRLIDCLLASNLLECLSVLASFLVAYTTLYLFDAVTPIHNPILMFGAWLLWTWYLFACGLVLACLSELLEWIEHFVGPIMYFSIPISGTFFLLDWIPQEYRGYLYWSPQVQINEMFRSSFFPTDMTFYWDIWYVIWPAVIIMAIGLYLYDYAKLAIRYE